MTEPQSRTLTDCETRELVAYEKGRADVRSETVYNGWRNYETWAVSLWLSSDSARLYDQAREAARELVATGQHPDHLREYVESYIWGDEAPASLGSDLIGGALSVVDWRAVVQALTEE